MMNRNLFRQIMAGRLACPGDGQLLAYRDRELRDRKRVRIQAHLNRCRYCRGRVADLGSDWTEFAKMSSAANAGTALDREEIIAGVRKSIGIWRSANLAREGACGPTLLIQTEAGRQAAAMLGVYIGRRAANALLQGIDAPQVAGREPLAQAESTLRILLGRKSAAALISRLAKLTGRPSEPAGGTSVL